MDRDKSHGSKKKKGGRGGTIVPGARREQIQSHENNHNIDLSDAWRKVYDILFIFQFIVAMAVKTT